MLKVPKRLRRLRKKLFWKERAWKVDINSTEGAVRGFKGEKTANLLRKRVKFILDNPHLVNDLVNYVESARIKYEIASEEETFSNEQMMRDYEDEYYDYLALATAIGEAEEKGAKIELSKEESPRDDSAKGDKEIKIAAEEVHKLEELMRELKKKKVEEGEEFTNAAKKRVEILTEVTQRGRMKNLRFHLRGMHLKK
jgi:hypothetical protein